MTTTTVPTAPSTAAGPTASSTWRSLRGPLLVLALLLAVLAGSALLTRGGPEGRLEPGAFSPAGARALAVLLEDRGVEVRRVEDVGAALEGDERTTLLVPRPAALTPGELARLSAAPGELVVLEAEQEQLDALGLAVDAGTPVEVEPRRAACDLPAAALAGDVLLGGVTYRAQDGEAVGCYASGGRPTLLRLPDQRVTLLGSGAPLTNERLDERGDAALALALLGAGDEVRWLVPAPGREVADGGQTPLSALLPPWVGLGALQLLVAAAVLALWRARQLGRVVPEPLPVVVRSAESVEGRARLYRAAGARDRAAEALRAAARDRLARRLGLPPGTAGPALVAAVVARTGRPVEEVDGLLRGAAPGDDDGLVALATALDVLVAEAGRGSQA